MDFFCEDMMTGILQEFKIVIDNGKPYEVIKHGKIGLRAELKKQYAESQKGDYAYFDVKVYNEKDEDISESQFITEMIGKIMDNCEVKK